MSCPYYHNHVLKGLKFQLTELLQAVHPLNIQTNKFGEMLTRSPKGSPISSRDV